MIYTAIDTFYLTDEQLKDSPSRKDGIVEETETTLRIYGCDLIQECGILLKLPQAVMATGQVLFHRFYCKKSFARFNVKRVAASCVWLASKLEESPRKARQILIVLHRMECRRENLPVEHLDLSSKKYCDLKMDLIRTERHLLKEMGFICHVEHPHKFISNYLATLETPLELRQEAWNLANDSLRTTLCVRFKSEVVACGVVYAAARRFQVPLPENPPWWKAFDADKSGIDEVCRVLAYLYSRPKAKYIAVCKDSPSFSSSNKSWDSNSHPVPKDGSLSTPLADNDTVTPKTTSAAANSEAVGSKDALIKQALDKLKESKRSDDDSKNLSSDGEGREDTGARSKPELRTEGLTERSKDRESEGRERERDKQKSRDRDRRRDSDRERERDDSERDRDKVKERSHRSKDKPRDSGGHSDKSRHHSSRDRDRDYHTSYSSREKDRSMHHSYS
ncbi:Cyclin-L1-1 [Dionaea muscipula]